MNRYSILLLFPVLMIMSECGSATVPLREQGELRGKIFVIGNDPFTKLALALDDRNSVVLLCPPEVEKYLRSHQGQSVIVTYEGTSQVPEGRAVRVTTAERVNQ